MVILTGPLTALVATGTSCVCCAIIIVTSRSTLLSVIAIEWPGISWATGARLCVATGWISTQNARIWRTIHTNSIAVTAGVAAAIAAATITAITIISIAVVVGFVAQSCLLFLNIQFLAVRRIIGIV